MKTDDWPVNADENSAYYELLEYLVQNGADVNAVDLYQATGLHNMAEVGDVKGCNFLLDKGFSNLMAKDSQGNTVLDYLNKHRQTPEIIALKSRITNKIKPDMSPKPWSWTLCCTMVHYELDEQKSD